MLVRLTQTRPQPTTHALAAPTVIGPAIPSPPNPSHCYDDFRAFLSDLNASSDYIDWCAAEPSDCARWTTYSGAILGGATPSPPAMSTTFGTALVDAGIIALDGIRPCRVAARIRAAFSFAVSGLTVAFSNGSTPGPSGPIINWTWYYGDGSSDSGPVTYWSPSHVYAGAGTYVVTLVVNGTSPDGNAGVSHSVTVFVPGTSGFHIDGVAV